MLGNLLKYFQLKNTTKSSMTPHCPPTTCFSSQPNILKMLSIPLCTYSAPTFHTHGSPGPVHSNVTSSLFLAGPLDSLYFSSFGPISDFTAAGHMCPLELLCDIIVASCSLGIFFSATFTDFSCSSAPVSCWFLPRFCPPHFTLSLAP